MMTSAVFGSAFATRSLGDGDTWDYLPAMIFMGAGPAAALFALWAIFAGVAYAKVSTLLATGWLCFYFASWIAGYNGMGMTIAAIASIAIGVLTSLTAPPAVRRFVWAAAVVVCVADAITYVIQVSDGRKDSLKDFLMESTTPRIVFVAVIALASIGHGAVVAKCVNPTWYAMAVTSGVGAFTISQPIALLTARNSVVAAWLCFAGAAVVTAAGTLVQLHRQAKKEPQGQTDVTATA